MTTELVDALIRYTDTHPGADIVDTGMGHFMILRSDQPNPPRHRLLGPALCIVAQGAKWASFGDRRLAYRAGEALVVGVATPSVGRVVEASPGKPCLVLVLELDLAIMRSVAETLDIAPEASGTSTRGVFVTDFQGPLADCALRIARLLDTPRAMPTLFPMIMREVWYWLLTGPHGGDIMQMCRVETPSYRVIGAIHSLRERFRQTIRIETLAETARMSLSAFHRQFKALTSLTPLQYQKQLRLLEARRLMISAAMNVEAAAFAVGYESPSQFSREYARMFGAPPKRDTRLAVTG